MCLGLCPRLPCHLSSLVTKGSDAASVLPAHAGSMLSIKALALCCLLAPKRRCNKGISLPGTSTDWLCGERRLQAAKGRASAGLRVLQLLYLYGGNLQAVFPERVFCPSCAGPQANRAGSGFLSLHSLEGGSVGSLLAFSLSLALRDTGTPCSNGRTPQ